jgi:two-component system NtrC family sensor kinase
VKRKFTLGISLLTIILFLFAILIFQTIKSVSDHRKIKNDHQIILTMYLERLSNTQKALIHLYQYKSGLRKEFDSMINAILQNDEIIYEIRNKYAINKDKAICSVCQDVDQKFSDLDSHLLSHQEAFKNALSNVITASHSKRILMFQNEAIRGGDHIIEAITDMWLKSRKMNTEIQAIIETKEIKARYLIEIFLFITIVASSIILTIMIRSISNPIKKLVTGINMISNGRFDSKVDIVSNDEFGYIARNFNAMADNLKKSIRERDAVTQELNELNCTLEKRVILKTQELREAHNNLIRTEGLAIAGTIAASIAHELSTPLSTLMGYCQLINRKIPEEIGIAPYCNIMEKEIERCSTIMTGMLNLTRISNEEKSLTDINAMITDMLLIVRIQADCANVTVKDELDPSIPHIMVNSLGLRQVFMNIIINALQSMPDGGEIHIATSLAEAGKKIEVTISDTGCGISETDMSRIFKSFYTTKKTGTGLGLSICYAIIQAHDGNIRVKSEIGKGTTINVFLPV